MPAGMTAAESFADPSVLFWTVGSLLLFLVLLALLSALPTPMKSKPAFCARNLVCTLAFMYPAYVGAAEWYSAATTAARADGYTATLFGFSDAGWALMKFMLGFQCFDIIVSASTPSLRKAEHLGHHILSACCALACLSGPLFSHYACFFFGAVEISSVPLTFVDIYRSVPALAKGSKHGAVNEASRSAFAVSFVALRVVYWPYVLWLMFGDMRAAHAAGDFRGFEFQFGLLFVVASMLSLLQQYWGQKVIRGAYKMITGDTSERDHED